MKTEKEHIEHITREEADNITDIELQKQLYEHIKLLMEKLNLSEVEAGKLLDVDPKDLLSLRFNAFMVDSIEKSAKEVVERYIEKNGLNPELEKKADVAQIFHIDDIPWVDIGSGHLDKKIHAKL